MYIFISLPINYYLPVRSVTKLVNSLLYEILVSSQESHSIQNQTSFSVYNDD